MAAASYDVFLSFRGEDTRYGFVSHLRAALRRKAIKTYIDNECLERGNEISDSLKQAIQKSKVSIIIFSENYASSSWCLDELVHILHCKGKYDQIVIPVFYHVEPTHVRNQQGRFGQAFSAIEKRYKRRVEQVNSWKFAISAAADLSGWDSNVIRSEAELVEKVVEDVKKFLKYVTQPSDDFKGLIGIKNRVEKIKSLLYTRTDDVGIIGIWGMGGIGKTTLAKVVFRQLSFQFESRCFLENIREKWSKGEKDYLRNELLYQLLEEHDLYNVRSRLHNKKVFIVLDDVDDQEQLQYLIEEFVTLLGLGSRIIMTTRRKEMLRYIRSDDAIYEVEGLNDDEARELFCLNAFNGNLLAAEAENMKIAERVVNHAKGIPLALKVFGSHLRCKKKENWERELNVLEQTPNEKIQNVLKVSLNGLGEKDHQTFLDVACFFKGMDRDYVEDILNAWRFAEKIQIDNLIDRSLLSITDSNSLWMHDLVQEMGWEIVQSVKKPEMRSRLWNAQDVIYVLKNNRGKEAIQGISLNMSDNSTK